MNTNGHINFQTHVASSLHGPIHPSTPKAFGAATARMKAATLKKLFAATITLVVAALFLLPSSSFAQTGLSGLFTQWSQGASEGNGANNQQSDTATELSDEFAGTHDSGNVHVSHGSAANFATCDVPITDPNGWESQPSIRSGWTDSITISNPARTGQSAVARFTVHLTGNIVGSFFGSGEFGASYAVFLLQGAGGEYSGNISKNGYQGTPISALNTFTFDVNFTFGTQYPVQFELDSAAEAISTPNFTPPPPPGGGTATADLTLSTGNFVVLDDQNNPIDFTAESLTGSARASNIPQGGSFTGFTLVNNAPSRLGTSLSLLDGTASAATNVQAAFIAPPNPAVIQLASDAVDFSGTSSDLVVIQMNYDPAVAQTLFGGETALRLAWLNLSTQEWVHAVLGNTRGTPQFFPRAYNAATDLHLGNFGLDTETHVVWAVLNHNSEFGVTVVPDPVGTVTPVAILANISTRLGVETGDSVLIGGFIISGPAGSTKTVLIRGIGPSLANFGVPGTIPDPLLELHKPDGSVVTNDNWGDAPNAGEIPAGFAPGNSLESAIYTTLGPGAYTAILKGAHGETGVGLAEVYDFETASTAKLANIATRGFVSTGDNVMIGGFIVGATGTARVIVRALGPSIPVAGALGDPTLELHDGSGTLVDSNDNWKTRPDGSSQQAEVEATTIPPTNDLESAIVQSLAPGAYTAIVRGKNDTTGVGLVEVYNLQ